VCGRRRWTGWLNRVGRFLNAFEDVRDLAYGQSCFADRVRRIFAVRLDKIFQRIRRSDAMKSSTMWRGMNEVNRSAIDGHGYSETGLWSASDSEDFFKSVQFQQYRVLALLGERDDLLFSATENEIEALSGIVDRRILAEVLSGIF
jgi:hypothetical protein